ncbi:hypothetical protein GCM10009663_41160 [Kitasatospora arboriphila]|uniref:Uncharacterized protein n=1 Tax=Kitasatospora arboriphila TaxID=258052 RepID=A0ABN1TLQ7_9ACTN
MVERKQPDVAGAEQGERVEVPGAAQQSPVQAVPGRAVVAAVGEVPDHLTRPDGSARGDRALDRQVGRPQRGIPGSGVGDRHHRSSGHRSGEGDDAGSGGPDRRADRRRHVDAPVPGRPEGSRRLEPAEQRTWPAHRPGPTGTGGAAEGAIAGRCPAVL